MVAILSRKFLQGLNSCIPCPIYSCLPSKNRLICENSPRYYHQFVVGFGQRLISPPEKRDQNSLLGPWAPSAFINAKDGYEVSVDLWKVITLKCCPNVKQQLLIVLLYGELRHLSFPNQLCLRKNTFKIISFIQRWPFSMEQKLKGHFIWFCHPDPNWQYYSTNGDVLCTLFLL